MASPASAAYRTSATVWDSEPMGPADFAYGRPRGPARTAPVRRAGRLRARRSGEPRRSLGGGGNPASFCAGDCWPAASPVSVATTVVSTGWSRSRARPERAFRAAGGRRMAERGAHVVDHVVPRVPPLFAPVDIADDSHASYRRCILGVAAPGRQRLRHARGEGSSTAVPALHSSRTVSSGTGRGRSGATDRTSGSSVGAWPATPRWRVAAENTARAVRARSRPTWMLPARRRAGPTACRPPS